MPTFFQRPENALKRANEFIDVGKKQRALDALYDVIKSKKHRTWQKIHEPIMEKYLELCVELKKSHVAKEGLYQYKNICQQVNIKSLEDVVRRYLALAEEKTEEARKESHQAVIDVDDLDVIQQPETLLLGGVSGEDTQDRTDRAILTPWVKFLWESYRQCLDLLRNNSSVEKLYQDIAQQAFKFCLKYARKTEFRKLCDNLRTHLGHIYKHQHQQRAINLNNPESQALHLETRLCQLDSAIQMELWQEAFKAVEDIHGLIALSKKPPKPSLMANYYQKLGLVFWKSGCHMFHACAWHRLFHLSREQRKNLTTDELQKLASHVVCATLAIPIPAARNQMSRMLDMDDATLEKQRRLATLLALQSPPTRASLIRDLSRYNIIQYVHPEMNNLYRWLEVDFHPLKLSKRVQVSIEYIKTRDELVQYVPAIQDITVTRLLKQVSQVYQTIEFSRLAMLAPFTNNFYLERVVVDSARKLDLQVRIDHRTKTLSFGTDLAVAQKEDVPEGPYLQNMPSENIRNQLTHLAASLEKAVNIIQPREINSKREEIRAQIVQRYRLTAKKDHENILMRRQIIEERKEEIESLNVKREREEVEQAESQRQQRLQAEMERLEREAQERARQRRLEEHKEIQIKAAKEKLEQLRSTELGARVFKDMDEENLAELDPDEIVARQVSQLEKEKKEMQEKLRQQEKKIDFLERAKRIEEVPMLVAQAEEDSEAERHFWEQQENERIEKLASERELALEHRDRLRKMVPDKEAFVSQLMEARMSVYEDKLAAFEKNLAEERKRRLADRKVRRKIERREKWTKHREEEAQRKIDEELVRQRDEEERLEREKREEEEREYTERLRKLEEIAEKQRQREAEIEERLRKGREESGGKEKKEDTWRRRGDDRDTGRDSGPRDLGSRDSGRDSGRDTWRRGGDREESDAGRDSGRDTWRSRGGDRDREEDGGRDGEDSGPAKSWRPSGGGGGGWREREKAREESWKKPEREEDSSRDAPARGGGWRDREERGGRDDRGGRDADRGGRDDRDGDRGGWRRGGDRDEDRDRGGSSRFGDRDSGRDAGGGGWRRGGDSDDRRPAPRGGDDDRSEWRRGGASRDEPRVERDSGRDEGSAWRRGGDRAPARDLTVRDAPAEEDRSEWRRGGGGGRPAIARDIRLDEPQSSAWRRPAADRDTERPSERPSEPSSGGGAWRRGGDREERTEDERPSWRERQAAMSRDARLDDDADSRPSWKERQAAMSRDARLDDEPSDNRPSWKERQAAMSRDARLDDPAWQKKQQAAKEERAETETARRPAPAAAAEAEPESSEDPGWTTVRR